MDRVLTELQYSTKEQLEKKGEKKQKTVKVEELSEYEKQVQENKNDKMAFLQSLKMNEIKEGFYDAVKDFSLAVRPKRYIKKRPDPVPRARIARSSKVYVNLSEKALQAKAVETEIVERTKRTMGRPSVLTFQDVLHSAQSYENFIDDFKDLHQGNTRPIVNYDSQFQNTKLLEPQIEKSIGTVLRAIDIHPMREKTIIACGGDNGNLSLWNVNSDPYAFEIHNKSISHIKFNPENLHHIVSSSCDGTLKIGDLGTNVYRQVYNSMSAFSKAKSTYFDFLSSNTCLVARSDGYVAVVDMRVPQTENSNSGQISHKCSYSIIKSVSVHPLNKMEFITPGYEGEVKMWDLRKLEDLPVSMAHHRNHNKKIDTAIFSPLTGKLVITSSAPTRRICMFHTSSFGMSPYCTNSIKRQTNSRATWQPRTDSIFAVGSVLYSRNIEIHNAENIYDDAREERVLGGIHICAFHPSLPIVAGTQTSKVYVFKTEEL